MPAESLWLPDVELLNGAAGARGAGGDGSLRARLSAAGDVEWITRIDVAVPVALDLRAWPRDVQTVAFKFGSREHTADELDLRISDYKVSIATSVSRRPILCCCLIQNLGNLSGRWKLPISNNI